MVEKEGRSVTRGRGITVAPSPFNEVKLDLAIILCVGVLLLLVAGRVVDSVWVQLGILCSYSLLGMTWLILRTRRIVRRMQRETHETQ